MPDDRIWGGYRMCAPCAEVRHDDCMGAEQWCECLAEIFIEAEDLLRKERVTDDR